MFDKLSVAVDSSATFSNFEESMTKRPIYTDQHHSEFAFHRFLLLREKKLLTDAVILSSDGERFALNFVLFFYLNVWRTALDLWFFHFISFLFVSIDLN